MEQKKFDYKKICLIVLTVLLILGLCLSFMPNSKAESFSGSFADSIFGRLGDNLLEEFVDENLNWSFVDNNYGNDTMLIVTNGSGSSYYLGTWYFDFTRHSYPYGYDVNSAVLSCSIAWNCVGGLGYFGSSSVVFELYDETANEIVGQDTVQFQQQSNSTGSLNFLVSLSGAEYRSHTFSFRLIISLRWAVNFSNAALYLSSARCLQTLSVSGETLPPPTPTPTPTPTPIPTPTPTPTPEATLPPLTLPPDFTYAPFPTLPHNSITEDLAFANLLTIFNQITSWAWYPVINFALVMGVLGSLAGLFSLIRKDDSHRKK